MRRALLTIMLTNLWALEVHGAPVTTIDLNTRFESYAYDAGTGLGLQMLGAKAVIAHQARVDGTGRGAGGGAYTTSSGQTAPFAAVMLARVTDPEPALLGILSLAFAGLLSIRRRRD